MRGLLVALAVGLCSMTAAQAQVTITHDNGGRIGTYASMYQQIAASGEPVVVDGLCASACTILLGTVPEERIFVTPRAKFGFHAAWDFGPGGRQVTNALATQELYVGYPKHIRQWIDRNGGLNARMIFLRGKSLARMGYQRYSPRQSYASAVPRW